MKRENDQSDLLRLFEGAWLGQAGNIAYAKMVKGQLLIPYSRSEESKLAGHYFNCRLIGNKLACRFERFEPYKAGTIFLRLGPNHTLQGGWCLDENLPPEFQKDSSLLPDDFTKMVPCVWIWMPNAKIPAWVKEYYAKDSPKK